LVAALNSALDAVLDAFQGAINAALAVLEAVLTGDWAGLALKVLEAVLRLLGIEPAAFYALVGKAVETVELIVGDPLGFLSNIVRAVVLGLEYFAGNLFGHLQRGVISWLTGALGGIQIPDKFDLAGLLDLARQILGLTWEWLREKAVRLIGEENVARLEFIGGYIQTLREGGFPALFDKLLDDLTGLADTVLSAIAGFITEKVIIAGITWLASLFSPVGAVVKLVLTIWNFLMFLRNQLARIIRVVQTVVEGLSNIARGIIEGAAKKVESVLADLLPVAIDLVAKLLGLTGVAARVREIISDIRAHIDRAVDSLIDRVLKTFRGGPEAEGELPAEEAETGPEGTEVGKDLVLVVPGEAPHTLSIQVLGTDASVIVSSDPLPVEQWLSDFERFVERFFPKGMRSRDEIDIGTEIEAGIREARGTLLNLAPVAGKSAKALAEGQVPSADVINLQLKLHKQLQAILEKLAEVLGVADVRAIFSIFSEQIAESHPEVRDSLKQHLENNSDTYQTMRWDEVRAALLKKPPFDKPMLKGHSFGKNAAQPAAVKVAESAEPEAIKGKEDNFLADWAAKKINNEGGEFAVAREELQRIMFEGGEPEASRGFQAGIVAALDLFKEKGAEADEDLRDGIGRGQIVPFLEAMARGQDFGTLKFAEWETRFWGDKRNQDWIRERFRGVEGGARHEWIPTDYIDKVVKRDRSEEEIQGGALWITFQNALRSPTKILVFPPRDSSSYLRTVDHLRDDEGKPREDTGDRKTFPVLQGHSGAVYAPVGNDGKYRDTVAAQTLGQPGWHNELRRIFLDAPSSRAGMKKIVDDLREFKDENVWNGANPAIPEPRFDEYHVAFATLESTASSARSTIDGNFNDAMDEVNR
jgi:hypothetical protein